MSNPAGIDEDTFLQLKELMEEMLDELLELFLNDTPELLSQLETAVNTGDKDTIAGICHPLKSSAANLGAEKIASLAQTMEERAEELSTEDAKDLFTQLKSAYEQASTWFAKQQS